MNQDKIKENELKKSIFKDVFNFQPRTLKQKYKEENLTKEKIYMNFPDLFSLVSKEDRGDIVTQEKFSEDLQIHDTLKTYGVTIDELNLINNYFEDDYCFFQNDDEIWNSLIFDKNTKFFNFQTNPIVKNEILYSFLCLIFLIFITNHFIATLFFVIYLFHIFIKIKNGISPESSVELFLQEKTLMIQNKKTTLINIIYHFLKSNSTDQHLNQKLKILLYKAHIEAEEKNLIPSYYSTRQLLIDYVYILIPYTQNMRTGNYLNVHNYLASILNSFKKNQHTLYE